MILVVPALIPRTTPVDIATVPTDGVLLLQVPPVGVPASVVVLPTHALAVPVTALTPPITFIERVTTHPPLL